LNVLLQVLIYAAADHIDLTLYAPDFDIISNTFPIGADVQAII
jgi:hypothetical protein